MMNCRTCKGPLTVINFDGVAAEMICMRCCLPSEPPLTGTPAQIRQARRTARGTVKALPSHIYAEVRASGPCVYCGNAADAVDHVRPLSQGGLDVRENLVPACKPCNQSKWGHLLTNWDANRVARGAAFSTVVAAELRRLHNEGKGARLRANA